MTLQSPHMLSLFFCYAHEDAALRGELDKHLAMLRRLGWIQSGSDRDILAGVDWQHAIENHLSTADLLVLLISADFINSDYCYSVEMQKALQRHQAGEAVVIPILVRPVEWEQTPLGKLRALPQEGLPVTSWASRDEAWKKIAAEIRTVVEVLRKPTVVVSLSSQQTVVVRLIDCLESQHIPVKQITLAPEQIEVRDAIRTSTAVVLIGSHDALHSRLLGEVENLITMYQLPVFRIWITDTELSGEQVNAPPRRWHAAIALEPGSASEECAFQEVLTRLKAHRRIFLSRTAFPPSDAAADLPNPRNPYKGLRAFTADDKCDFFGRDAAVDQLIGEMETMLTLEQKGRQNARLLAVIGASGSGKSSVVMAGLLPCLQTGSIDKSDEWVYLNPLVPGEHPLEALALSLSNHFPEKSREMLDKDLHNDDARGLHFYASALAGQRRSVKTRVVLVIDQFEELFTLTIDEAERRQFIDLLVTACTQRGGPLVVILTMRADFYDRPMQYPTLYTLLVEHQTPLLPMALDDLRAVITQPARLDDVQLIFEDNLVGDLLFDVQGQSGALPLLQFTLDQLFQQREERRFTLQAYHELGGVKGALSRHAEQTYQDLLSDEHRACAHILFLRLIDPGMTEQDTARRRADRLEFIYTDITQTRRMQEAIEAFVRARLLTTNQINNRTTIEVSHEAVLREWKRLADWLREARDDIHFQQTLSEDVAQWEQRQCPKDHLYRGVQLKEAQAWARRNTVSKHEQAFLHASAVQRLRLILIVMVGILLIVATSGITGWILITQPKPNYVTSNSGGEDTGSLRWAIQNAIPGSTITFAPYLRGQTIIWKNDDIHITQLHLTIRGPAYGSISIQETGVSLIVYPQAGVTISNIVFQGNSGTGNKSLLDNQGKLELDHCSTVGNTIKGNGGGGIINRNNGNLTITNSTISGNTVINGYGGGINNGGNLTITDSTISNNMITSDGSTYSKFVGTGGGINNDGKLIISHSVISGNKGLQGGSGGGIGSAGNLMITDSTILDNRASSGGGIAMNGTATISRSSISGNTAYDGNGGGITHYGYLTPAIITNSTISDNTANNGSGGGIMSGNILTVINSTISGNVANNGNGGGIDVADSFEMINTAKSSLIFCTIFNNRVFGGDGNDVASNQFPPTIKASIIGNNTNTKSIIAGQIQSEGYNVIQHLPSAGIVSNSASGTDRSVNDFVSVFGQFPNLQMNGGSTPTYQLLPDIGNPALNTVPLLNCQIKDILDNTTHTYIDQRGMLRPGGNERFCDSGAYEYQSPS